MAENQRHMVGQPFTEVTNFVSNVVHDACWGTWRELANTPSSVGFFGIHPSMAGTHKVPHSRLTDAVAGPSCVAVGECRFDTHRASRQEKEAVLRVQETVFRMQLRLAKVHKKPVVLHIRARDGDADGLSALYSRAIAVMRGELSTHDHSIYLHSFVGRLEDLTMWVRAFPGVAFGLNALAMRIDGVLKASHSVGLERICLETDLPHFLPLSIPLHPVNIPWNVDQVAEAMAVEWNLPVRVVCDLTRRNAIRVFRL